jgi:hypothetical protein
LFNFIFVYASIVIYSAAARQWMRRALPSQRPVRPAWARACAVLAAGFALGLAAPAAAQWRIAAPPAATAWFAALDSLRLAGRGALPLTRSQGAPRSPLGQTLAADRYAVLHFAPLYYPSATLPALADAVEDAAGTGAPRAPRAQFLVGAIRQALPDTRDRRALAELAALARVVSPPTVPAAQLAVWQTAWDGRFALPLLPFLRAERLDGGVLMIIPSLGAEGRLFAGVPGNRTDNLIAVQAPLDPNDADGPLYAAVRELCFPLVSRTADATPEFRSDARSSRDAARRASLAAVRCGADLLDRLAPREADGYRAHWRAVAGGAGSFDTLFPPDAVLTPRVLEALPAAGRAP